MELKVLAKNVAILSSSKVINFFLKIIRAKINALILGTTGIGIISQLTILSQQFSQVSMMSMNVGAKKIIAEKKDTKIGEIPNVIKTYLLLILPLIIVTFIVGLIFNKPIANFILGENELSHYFLIIFIVFPFISLNSVSELILGGFKKFKFISLKEIITSVVSLAFFIPLVLVYHLNGAIVALALTIIVTFLIGLIYAFKKTLFKMGFKVGDFIKAKFNKIYSKEMLTVGGIGMTVGYYKIFVELTSRSILVNKLGIDKVGVYAPIIAWSGLFIGFIYPSIWQYLFPRICEAKNDSEIIDVVNDVLRLMTFITIPFVFIGISFRELIIPLFYSHKFTSAALYLPLHFLGTFFLGWLNALLQIFIPTGRIKRVAPFTITANTLYLCSLYFLTPHIGLWAWTIRYSIIPFFILIACVIFLHFEIGFFIKRENIFIMTYAIIGGIVIWVLNFSMVVNILISFLAIGSVLLFMKKSEKAVLKQYLFKISRGGILKKRNP